MSDDATHMEALVEDGDKRLAVAIADVIALTAENTKLRAELELWKAAEEMRGRQLAAVARERNAYSEEAEKIEAALAPYRKPGEDVLAVIARLTATRGEP